jgi:hypothetical protein
VRFGPGLRPGPRCQARWVGIGLQGGDAAGTRDQFAALLPIRERVQGPEHPDTLTARHSLAYWTGKADTKES